MSKENIMVSDKIKVGIITFYAIVITLSAFIFNTAGEIFNGMRAIALDPSILVSDYMVIGNLGAALFNSGLLTLVAIGIVKLNKVNMNGTTMAAILTVTGFALFGKNIYNIWSILLGVYLYSRVQKEKFSKFILIALFGTALGPMVSQISFGLELPLLHGIILGNVAGLIAGFVLPPLANQFIKFHQGFNLYNIGFTAGVVGSIFMAILRAYGLNNTPRAIVAEGYNFILGTYLTLFFVSMIILGFIFNQKSFRGYGRLLKHSGRAVADYVILEGFGLSLINMGILGLATIAYILLVNGQLNGPIIGGVFTVVGFGAFGKHIKNVIPIMVGVYLASLTQTWNINATGPLLAALFGTTLAPVAGQFGWASGIIAGFLHMAMVMNVGYLHGGMNLYNNGFSGGFVAATLVPIIDSLRKEENGEK